MAKPVALLLAVVACDSQEIAQMDFCREYARVECLAVRRACGVADEEACGAQREIDCQARSRKWLVGAKGYSALGARVCIDRMSAVYRQSFILGTDWRDVDETCEHSFFGHRRRGEACQLDKECQGEDSCRKGVCLAWWQQSATDTECGTMRLSCPAGLVCDYFPGAIGYTCRELSGPGGSCTQAQQCRDDARCQMGVCVARTPLGGECFEDHECVLPSAFCDPASFTCNKGFAVTPQSQFCQPYLRARPREGGSGLSVTSDGPGPDL
jgi:hypothetical protein